MNNTGEYSQMEEDCRTVALAHYFLNQYILVFGGPFTATSNVSTLPIVDAQEDGASEDTDWND